MAALAKITVHFIETGESAVVTASGTYEQEGDQKVVRDAEGRVLASFEASGVTISAARLAE